MATGNRILEMVFVCLLFNFASAKIRDVEAYRKHLEVKRERLSRLFKSKYTADTDPLDPGNTQTISQTFTVTFILLIFRSHGGYVTLAQRGASSQIYYISCRSPWAGSGCLRIPIFILCAGVGRMTSRVRRGRQDLQGSGC